MANPYNYVTQAQAVQQIANRLFDPTQTFWTAAELSMYLDESLRTFNALTGYWRDDFVFPSAPGVTWYDLTDTAAMPNTLRPYTIQDSDLYLLMQYHLLEPPTVVAAWTGSLQFYSDDFINAVQRRRAE